MTETKFADDQLPVVDVPHGGTGQSSFTANELVASGTTTTGSVQQIANVAAGHVLTDNGPENLPTMQTPSVTYTQMMGFWAIGGI